MKIRLIKDKILFHSNLEFLQLSIELNGILTPNSNIQIINTISAYFLEFD
jgi:hypothetical protein